MAMFKKEKQITFEDVLKMVKDLSKDEQAKITEMLNEPIGEDEPKPEESNEESNEVEKSEEEEKPVEEENSEMEEPKAEESTEAPAEESEEENSENPEVIDEQKEEAQAEAHEAKMTELSDKVSTLEAQLNDIIQRFENGGFGAKSQLPPQADNGEWKGNATQSYFNR